MAMLEQIAQSAKTRILNASAAIQNTIDAIDSGRPLDAERDWKRKVERVASVANVSQATAERIANYEDPTKMGLSAESEGKAEAIQGTTVDYLGAAWLESGRIAADTVARIVYRNGRLNGTGFLVSDRLLLTNNHVIASPADAKEMIVEFRYEIRRGEVAPAPVRFELDPDTFFETDEKDDLDFTLVALGRPLGGGSSAEFGFCPLSSSSAKHSVGEAVNIVQHPAGDYKQVVVRENNIVHRGDTVLHYKTDTEPGASGSPVFNDEWQVVALHHWGAPHREVQADGRPLEIHINEGIRVSAILAELQSRSTRLSAAQRGMLAAAQQTPTRGTPGSRVVAPPRNAGPPAPPRRPSEGGGDSEAGGAPASWIDTDYSNRRGYNPRFLEGWHVPMPQLNAGQRAKAARLRGVGPSGDPFELKYEHFSAVVRADRRMAFYSICNVDGGKRNLVARKTGIAAGQESGGETWAVDPRVPPEAQLDDAFYDRLRDRRRDRQRDDFFARGHLTQREEPGWGNDAAAERANADTFHHPNAAPQLQSAFNNSSKVWRAIEKYVVGSSDESNLKVTVITGPVFRDDDPVFDDTEFGDVRLPRQFWKIVARVESGERKVVALLADQSEAMEAALATMRPASEAAWDFPASFNREFITTVAHLTEITGLDFGDLAEYDLYAGGVPESLAVTAESLLPRHSADGVGFGRFESLGEFLKAWEARPQPAAAEGDAEGAESRRGRNRQPGRSTPRPRARKVAEVEASVTRIFADDVSGAMHQQFTATPTRWLAGDPAAKAGVDAAIEAETEVRLAVRFGDARGLPDRIPGIRTGVALHIKGEWIPADEAFAIGGERLAVLHFTHDPLGFICTPAQCYS